MFDLGVGWLQFTIHFDYRSRVAFDSFSAKIAMTWNGLGFTTANAGRSNITTLLGSSKRVASPLADPTFGDSAQRLHFALRNLIVFVELRASNFDPIKREEEMGDAPTSTWALQLFVWCHWGGSCCIQTACTTEWHFMLFHRFFWYENIMRSVDQ